MEESGLLLLHRREGFSTPLLDFLSLVIITISECVDDGRFVKPFGPLRYLCDTESRHYSQRADLVGKVTIAFVLEIIF